MNALAEAVAFIFLEIGEPVTEGTDSEGQPSTKFGWIIKGALEHHGIDASWLSPTRRIARRWKDGWRP